MAGIYIHIPYCRKACYYCNFHFSTTLNSMDDMVKALGNELKLQRKFLKDEIRTIYFGGGTPSILSATNISYLLDIVHSNYSVSTNPEITLEANPDDINEPAVVAWKEFGINRISLGIQSFDDSILNYLNRSHSSHQAFEAINLLKHEGLNNITVDLIYGIPGQHHDQWKNNLEHVVNLGIAHLSAYALTIEEKTVFGNRRQHEDLQPVSDRTYETDYTYMCEYLKSEGYDHYEVSNFAKPGARSIHNTSYWQQVIYLGIGPGAHSYNGNRRFFNHANNAAYIKSISKGLVPHDSEVIGNEEQYNEYLLTGLRTDRGISITEINNRFSFDLINQFKGKLHQFEAEGLLNIIEDRIILTDKGLFLSDSIIIDLMK